MALNRFAIPLVTIGFLCGCSSAVKVGVAPNPGDYSECRKVGSSGIAGETFSKTKSGIVMSGAGVALHADPVSGYSTALFRALREHGVFSEEKEADTHEPLDVLMLNCRRTTKADSAGRFAFERLPAGEYFVSSYIRWTLPSGSWRGTWHVARVRVRDGETKTGVTVY